MKRLLGLLLAVLIPALALASCGNGSPLGTETGREEATLSATEATTKTAAPASTAEATAAKTTDETAELTTEATTEATTDKWEEIATKITMITASDRNLKIECSEFETAEKASRNDVYLKGPDAVEDGVTPAIQTMVYERNRAADALLGTTTTFVFWDYDWGKQGPQIDLVVKGKAADAPDLFVNMLYDLNKELLNATFKDVWSIPNSYFDFTAEGWLSAWMENLSFTGDRAYILGSDYFLDVFRAIPLLPFNMTMMDENAVKLAPVILGEDEKLGAGEALTTYFFDLVEEGNWTWDVLGKLCEATWVDVNNDGQDSIGDVLGIIADEYGGINSGSFVYSCGENLTAVSVIEDETSEYNGKQWIKYADTSAGLNRIFDEVKAVFDGPGSLSTRATYDGDTPDNPGVAYHHIKFAASELLFAGVCLLGGLEDDAFQTMTDLYSVVPCPKTDVSKEYNSIVHNVGDAGAMNVNANPRKARVVSAYLQYCTEKSPAIREEFLEIVTKYKTTTYNQGTDRMLEIIYDSILLGRDKTVDDLVGGDRWHVLIKNDHFGVGSDYISSRYESLRSSKQTQLDTYMKKWYTLPKTEPKSE